MLPFIVGRGGQQFKPDVLSVSLQQIFGANFTSYSAEALSKGLLDDGYIRHESDGPDGAIFYYTDKINDLNVDQSVSQAEADIDVLMDEFDAFLKASSPIFSISYTGEQWRDMFVLWSTTVDVSDKDGLQAWVDKFISGEKKAKVSLDGVNDVEERFLGLDRHVVVLFASYAKWLSEHRYDLFSKVATLAEIGFLIDLVSELREPVRGRPQKIHLSVVVDGPVLLDLMGLMGLGRRSAALSMLKICSDHKIPVIALQHSIQEASEIVKTVLAKAAPARFGMVADTLKSDRLAEKRAMDFISKPDQELKKLDVQIVNAELNVSFSAKQTFTDEMVFDLASRLPYSDGSVSHRRTRDAKSVGFVMRRRGGHHTSDMYDARYILLTRSAALARSASSYVARNLDDVPSYAVPPVLELRHFSTMSLLAFGTADGESISRGELLASCERMLQTSPKLIKRVRETVEQLSLFSSEQLDAVMMDPIALYEVVTATGNDPEVISATTAEALAKIIHEAAAKDERIRHEKEMRETAEAHVEEVNQLTMEAEQAKLSAATSALALKRTKAEADRSAVVLLSDWYGEAKTQWSAVVVLTVLVSLLAVTNVFVDGAIKMPLYMRLIIAGCVLISAAYAAANRLIEKFSLLSLRKYLRKRVVDKHIAKMPEGSLKSAIEELRDD